MNSLRSMLEFFQMENESEQSQYLEAYIKHDRTSFELMRDVRESDDINIWEKWRFRIEQSEDSAAFRARIALARGESRGTVLPEYLDLYSRLRFSGIPDALSSEHQLPLLRMLNAASKESQGAVEWALQALLDDFGSDWLELLNRWTWPLDQESAAIQRLQNWLMRLPTTLGSTGVAHRAVGGWFNEVMK